MIVKTKDGFVTIEPKTKKVERKLQKQFAPTRDVVRDGQKN